MDFRISKITPFCPVVITSVPNYFYINCNDFSYNSRIPSQYTYNGGNIVPEFVIENIPDGCKSLVLFCIDHEARPVVNYSFVHWNIYIPINGEKRIVISGTDLPGQINGKNSFGSNGWGGPAPPPGTGTHRYYFNVFSLFDTLSLTSGFTIDTLFSNLYSSSPSPSTNIMTSSNWIGTYSVE